ncbi:MAG: hypothetical protein IJ877_05345 [Candidatus Gastranaerophilales bacterium]|nr:hypothetical protein [Candidatus Gastranaerophilales bacterium]
MQVLNSQTVVIHYKKSFNTSHRIGARPIVVAIPDELTASQEEVVSA